MNNIPAGWVWAPVNDLCQFNPKTTAEDDSACGFVPMQGLGTRYRADTSIEQRAWGDVKKAYTHFQNGDVLVAKVTPCFENGKAGIARNLPNGIGAGSSEFCVFRPHPGIDSKYLLGCFSTEDFRRRATVAMTGSVGLKRVPKDVFLGEQIPLAPAAEQTRIADKLDAVLSRVDDVNARLDRVAPLLKRFRQSVLAAATSGRLTEDWREQNGVPFPWENCLTKDAGKIQLGRQRSPKYHSGANMRPYLRVQNVFEDRIDLSDVMSMDFDEADFERYRLKSGDILLNEGQSPEYLGRPALFRDELPDACFTNTLIRFQARDHVAPEFALLVFRHYMHSGRYLQEGTTTTNIAHLGAGRFGEVEFPLPTRLEQEEIAQRSKILFAFADRLEARLKAARTAAQRLTPAVLAKAFRGELVAQDPADEPAAELLQRLAAQRPQAPVGAQRSRSGARS